MSMTGSSWTLLDCGHGVPCQIQIRKLSAPDTNMRKQPEFGFGAALSAVQPSQSRPAARLVASTTTFNELALGAEVTWKSRVTVADRNAYYIEVSAPVCFSTYLFKFQLTNFRQGGFRQHAALRVRSRKADVCAVIVAHARCQSGLSCSCLGANVPAPASRFRTVYASHFTLSACSVFNMYQ